MQILTRKTGDAIKIGDNIEIAILDIVGNQAKIGIDTPMEIEVHREEVYERIQQEKNDILTA